MSDPTIMRTPAPGCPACEYRMRHTAEEWKLFHPKAGQGFRKGNRPEPTPEYEGYIKSQNA